MKRLHWAFTGALAAVAAVQAWQSRHFMNGDGVAYLDMATNYLEGQWRAAMTAYWPPLYSWILAVGLGLLRPSPEWEFPAVHAVNFGIFLGALAGFRFFLKSCLEARSDPETEKALVVFGYTVFGYAALALATLRLVTPDLCLAGLVFAAGGLIVKRRGGSWLGLALGLGFLAKSALMPLGVVMAAVMPGRERWKALAVFAGVTGAWVAALSAVHGRLVWNESARLNYAWSGRTPGAPMWAEPGDGRPPGAPRLALERPQVIEADRPLRATNQLRYDPAYWYAGMQVRPGLRNEAEKRWSRLLASQRLFRDTFVKGWQISLVFPVGLLVCLGGALGAVVAGWRLIVPAVAAFGMYALVDVELRYLAPFVPLFWLGLALGAKVSREHARAAVATAALAAAVGFPHLLRDAVVRTRAEAWQVATALRGAGLREGDRVGEIGMGSAELAWARLARVRVTAHVTRRHAESYWQAPAPEVWKQLGVKAVMTIRESAPPEPGWQRVAGTSYWYRVVL
jgi:hypothetical protein